MKLAIISDIHEDIVNLKIALQRIEKEKVDEIICLGDISGFSVPHYRYFDTRDAHACLSLVKSNCSDVIIGNHDLYAAKRLPKISPEFSYPPDWYEFDYLTRKELSKGEVWLYDHDELDPLYTFEDIEYLNTLPEVIEREFGPFRAMLTHYMYPNLTGSSRQFYHNPEEFSGHFGFMDDRYCQLGFVGHAHAAGLIVGTEKEISRKRFNRRYFLREKAIITVPAIAGNTIGNGFCIFDTEEVWIKAVRI